MPKSLEKELQRLESQLRNLANLPPIAGGAPMSAEFLLSRINDVVEVWTPGGSVGVTDHGDLTGLADDDHTQYLKEKSSGGLAAEVPTHNHESSAQAGLVTRDIAIRLYSELTAGTININSTSYGTAIPFEFTIDLDWFPFTDFKITLVGQASEAAQTITLQLATFGAPTTPIHTGGNDLIVTNGFAAFDSGWLSRDDGATGSKTYRICGKGSNGTVDFAVTWCQIDLRIVP